MCTAISFVSGDHYLGRTLDLDCSYGEEIVILPRRFPLVFRLKETLFEHYAMIGMATVVNGHPLFYDAANEHGLSMAGLNFPGNAVYYSEKAGLDNITPFEFIPWILGRCRDLSEAREALLKLNLVNIAFSHELPLSPLHFIVADKSGSLVVETTKEGMTVYENPVGVMTNNPPFDYQLFNLNGYRHLSVSSKEASFPKTREAERYCQGLGALGLPGDVSSMSRFVRALFLKENALPGDDELSRVSQVFHMMSGVEMVKGACLTDHGRWDFTVYTACLNSDRGIYYYTTYGNRRISAVSLSSVELDGKAICRYPLIQTESVVFQN